MELKTNTPVGPKFVFEKIKYKVLHYIQHDFIRQRLGLSKDQASMMLQTIYKVEGHLEISASASRHRHRHCKSFIFVLQIF